MDKMPLPVVNKHKHETNFSQMPSITWATHTRVCIQFTCFIGLSDVGDPYLRFTA
jgi:hypothetical protein